MDEIKLVDSNDIEYIKCEDVKEEELDETIEIAEKMIEFCVNNGGAGLAAPQIGIFKNFFVYSPKEEIFKIAINPSYYPDGKKTNTVESCLSYPNQRFYLKDKRYKYIRGVYYGRSKETGKMEKVTQRMRKEEAIIFQHETDHLNGKTINTEGTLLE